MSTPSFTISHSGLNSLSRLTACSSDTKNSSTSSSIVKRPSPILSEVWARSSVTPNALSTQDGSSDQLVHAEPELIAYFLRAMSRLSPSTKAKEIFRFPGYRCTASPLSWICEIFSFTVLRILFESRRMWFASFCISLDATSQAFPSPTTKAGGRVPDLSPLSWPPPLIKGVILTLGFRLMQMAPTPLGPQILCPLMLKTSIFKSLTLIGTFPTAWAASV